MIRIDDLALFVRSAALGSFSAAAREINLLPGQVSAAIQRLERDLGIRLFARSTRSLRLTADGEQYLPYAQGALESLREGHERVHAETTSIKGVLQIAAPSDLGRNVLLPMLTAFRRAHPQLTLRLSFSDQVADVFRDPVDVALRYGNMEDSSYVAMPVDPGNRRVVVAAPSYLAAHGAPESIDALTSHACLRFMLHGRVYDKWTFQEDGKRRVVAVSGPLVSDDADIVRRWAVAGEGIAYKSRLDVAEDLAAGRLVALLDGVGGDAIPLNLVCPHRKQFSPAIRLLHTWLQEHVARHFPAAAAPKRAAGGRARKV
ncbi:LysR family transcriptional regulator [Cupriavidus plantarum]|uniref:DNA-binding transcriptional LysR family regulator n=1 Tax=Cupriavidus plantarum TaxID=942865 RepID=A0A316EWH0_9BURK|nr:LysR family transcriptional regulator [Cupriavidus plantarum]PWK35509.1 DNA-binding transcriptional LysR family regulator [Cupriavidus plantarum]